MRLSIQNKIRVVTIYLNVNLHLMKNRFAILKQLAAGEDIETSEKSLKRIVQRWQETGSFLKISLLNN